MTGTQKESPELIPVRVVRVDPPNVRTADCAYIARCDDGSDYAIKVGNPVSHSEWFCYQFGEQVGLASPTCKVVEFSPDTKHFGSRWEPGEVKNWVSQVTAGNIKLDDIKAALSRIYAFDLFVYNVDRHEGNYMVRPQSKGHAVIAHDYSRAWLQHGMPPPSLPLPACHTVDTHRRLRKEFGDFFVLDEAKHILENIRKVTALAIGNIIDRHPASWLTNKQVNDILGWWKSKERQERIDKILQGVADGSYR